MKTENTNQSTIEDLKNAIAYLQSHPDLPKISFGFLHVSLSTKEELQQAARAMGSCRKRVDDYSFTLRRTFGEFNFDIAIPREMICKKIVTWDCPDDALLDSIEVEELPTL